MSRDIRIVVNFILLTCGIIIILLNVFQMIDFYRPRIGPIGNGITPEIEKRAWREFSRSVFGGLCFVALAIIQIVKMRKSGSLLKDTA